MVSLALLTLALGSVSYARPTTVEHSTASWCSGLGGGAFDSAQNFTLAAYNTSSANANATGVPLVLGQNGSGEGAESKVLSTYATYPYNDFPNLSLLNGALIPNPNSENAGMHSTDVDVSSGDLPAFLVSSKGAIPAPAQVYCAVADTDPDNGRQYPLLAVNGETDQFSLCMSSSSSSAQSNVVYQPTSDNSGAYSYDSCQPVVLHLVGLD